MEVIYIHETPSEHYGNIMWKGRYPMRRGEFPKDHPASANECFGSSDQIGQNTKMLEFRARGYWASCFPEGDGITMKTENGQTREQVIKDIQEVFGWKVVEKL